MVRPTPVGEGYDSRSDGEEAWLTDDVRRDRIRGVFVPLRPCTEDMDGLFIQWESTVDVARMDELSWWSWRVPGVTLIAEGVPSRDEVCLSPRRSDIGDGGRGVDEGVPSEKPFNESARDTSSLSTFGWIVAGGSSSIILPSEDDGISSVTVCVFASGFSGVQSITMDTTGSLGTRVVVVVVVDNCHACGRDSLKMVVSLASICVAENGQLDGENSAEPSAGSAIKSSQAE